MVQYPSLRWSLSLSVVSPCLCVYRYHMAAVFIPPSPRTSLAMSTRRAPLANVPNAANSPHRTGIAAMKRSRTAGSQVDIPYGQPPPKKQHVDREELEPRSPTRPKTTIYPGAESKFFTKRTNNAQPSAFEKKLVAARDKERLSQTKGVRYEKTSAETLDNIRQWQRHYRKAFPQFVFYFDSIPEDVRNKCSRQVTALGAVSDYFVGSSYWFLSLVLGARPVQCLAGHVNIETFERLNSMHSSFPSYVLMKGNSVRKNSSLVLSPMSLRLALYPPRPTSLLPPR